MSRFKKAIKKKELESALSKHPLRELDEQVKSDYVKGLVFVATEDGNFHEEEKSYIVSLLKNIGLDEVLLEEYTTFASNCEEEELLSFMDRIKEFDKDIKLNFLIEVIVLAFKDGEFDESEQSMFDDYLEMLELTEQKDDIMYMALALVNKDIDLALSLYTAKKEFFNKLDYMFDMIDIDIEKELKELYSWEWVEFRLKTGQVENDNLVASRPVTVRQFCVSLNSDLISKKIVQVSNSTKFENTNNKELIIGDIEETNLDFEDGLFSYSEDIQNDDYTGTKELTPEYFSNWINNNNLGIMVKGLRIIANYSQIELEDSTKGFLTDNSEQFIAYTSLFRDGDKLRFINVDHTSYENQQFHSGEENCLKYNVNYAFRLMKAKEDLS